MTISTRDPLANLLEWLALGLGAAALFAAALVPWSWIPAVVGTAAVGIGCVYSQRTTAGRWSALIAVMLGSLAVAYTIGFNVAYGLGMGDPDRDSVPRRGSVEMPAHGLSSLS